MKANSPTRKNGITGVTDASGGNAYFTLIRRFPLRPIRTASEYQRAAQILDSLVLRRKLSEGEKDFMDALSVFIEEYDRRHNVFDTSNRTPLDMLRHLMEANEMTVSDLGEVLGSKGIASEILRGKRSLSKTHVFKLAQRFNVDGGLFLEKPQARSAPGYRRSA